MRPRPRGFSLLEVMVAVAVISLVAMLIYGAFVGMARSRKNMVTVSERHQQARQALTRMARELTAAYISTHRPFTQVSYIQETGFQGSSTRVDFTAFANIRFQANERASDQAEIGYFLSPNPDTGGTDLVRRLDRTIDDDATRGGVIQVMAENVVSLQLSYLDPLTNEWTDDWNSTQGAGQLNRVPSQVWIRLELEPAVGSTPIEVATKATLPIQLPLDFATN